MNVFRYFVSKSIKPLVIALAASAVALPAAAWTGSEDPVEPQVIPNRAVAGPPRVVQGERYAPGIWIDPDGCEHWVMDDGVEGYMSPHRQRNGAPVCHRQEICGVLPTDQYFITDRYTITAAGQARLQQFFRQTNAYAYLVYGHTDSRASDNYNMTLSKNRAIAVANVAASVGARVVDIRGFGERAPRASNMTTAGQAQNRRVEIYCLR